VIAEPDNGSQMLTFLRQAVDRIYTTVEGVYLPSGYLKGSILELRISKTY
jgi:hypothetical protein